MSSLAYEQVNTKAARARTAGCVRYVTARIPKNAAHVCSWHAVDSW